jgi:hypothetical protein
MFNSSNAMHALDRALDSPAATALALVTLLAVPLAATSGIVRVNAADSTRPAAPAGTAKPAPNYQMRCWQQGRLLFEQDLDALPAEGTRYTLKISGEDRYGHPVYVAETSNATCLIRSMGGTRIVRAD